MFGRRKLKERIKYLEGLASVNYKPSIVQTQVTPVTLVGVQHFSDGIRPSDGMRLEYAKEQIKRQLLDELEPFISWDITGSYGYVEIRGTITIARKD